MSATRTERREQAKAEYRQFPDRVSWIDFWRVHSLNDSPSVQRARRGFHKPGKYFPHQGKREIARRAARLRSQVAK